jgi:hypothetical protein
MSIDKAQAALRRPAEGWTLNTLLQAVAVAERALSEAAAPSPVPAGWQLVPVEPTTAMRDRAMDVLMNTSDIYTRGETIVVETITTADVWRAMLSAAPGAPTSAPKGTT